MLRLQGLSYLHSVNITHGDLKPGNVLLKSSRLDRRGFTVRLADFGFCRIGGEGQGRRWAQGDGGGLGQGGRWVKGKRGRAVRQAWADTAAALNSRLALACAELAVRAKMGDGVKVEVGEGGQACVSWDGSREGGGRAVRSDMGRHSGWFEQRAD